jgi:hypothetical protein
VASAPPLGACNSLAVGSWSAGEGYMRANAAPPKLRTR